MATKTGSLPRSFKLRRSLFKVSDMEVSGRCLSSSCSSCSSLSRTPSACLSPSSSSLSLSLSDSPLPATLASPPHSAPSSASIALLGAPPSSLATAPAAASRLSSDDLVLNSGFSCFSSFSSMSTITPSASACLASEGPSGPAVSLSSSSSSTRIAMSHEMVSLAQAVQVSQLRKASEQQQQQQQQQQQPAASTPQRLPSELASEEPILHQVLDFAASRLLLDVGPCDHEEDRSQYHPEVELTYFMKEVIERSKTSFPVVVVGLVYLDRLTQKLRQEGSRPVKCPHKLFLACLVLACKYSDDHTYTNFAWTLISKTISVKDLNRIERLLLKHLDFKLTITREDMNSYLNQNFCLGQTLTLMANTKTLVNPLSPRRWYQFMDLA